MKKIQKIKGLATMNKTLAQIVSYEYFLLETKYPITAILQMRSIFLFELNTS